MSSLVACTECGLNNYLANMEVGAEGFLCRACYRQLQGEEEIHPCAVCAEIPEWLVSERDWVCRDCEPQFP